MQNIKTLGYYIASYMWSDMPVEVPLPAHIKNKSVYIGSAISYYQYKFPVNSLTINLSGLNIAADINIKLDDNEYDNRQHMWHIHSLMSGLAEMVVDSNIPNIYIMCAAGINRSALLCCYILLQYGYSGAEAVRIMEQVNSQRGCPVLTNSVFKELVML